MYFKTEVQIGLISRVFFFQCLQEPPQKKRKTTDSDAAALCVAANGDDAAVGYHGDGIRLFSLTSGAVKNHIYKASSLNLQQMF